eukprot:Selendium_serpulae@DN6484_c4_g2_i5.p1
MLLLWVLPLGLQRCVVLLLSAEVERQRYGQTRLMIVRPWSEGRISGRNVPAQRRVAVIIAVRLQSRTAWKRQGVSTFAIHWLLLLWVLPLGLQRCVVLWLSIRNAVSQDRKF